MHRIDGDAHVGNLFDEGDPGVPTNPTQITAKWLNAVQEELAAFIEVRGLTLDDGNNDQLTEALATVTRVAPSLDPNWTSGPSATPTLKYYKDALGHVHLEGFCRHATDGHGVAIFTLPSGFRPPLVTTFAVQCGTSLCRIQVDATGVVTPYSATGSTAVGTENVCLHGVSFHV